MLSFVPNGFGSCFGLGVWFSLGLSFGLAMSTSKCRKFTANRPAYNSDRFPVHLERNMQPTTC